MTEETFDAVIVGSGFGGSVLAYRLQEAGLRVCLLERGKAWPPGSFPRSPADARTGLLWDPSAGLHGLFNVWSFKSFEAIVASGLGGGSLVYSNVSIRKDEKWFVREDAPSGEYEYWPVTRADLDPHYDRVERVLNVQAYPVDHAPYSATPRTHAFRDAAARLNMPFITPPLAVTFHNTGHAPGLSLPLIENGPNLHHAQRYTCRLCGECNIGCNYGSKNSLDYTYLSLARRAGADIRTRCEVRSFEPLGEGKGYQVRYVSHESAADGEKRDTGTLLLHTLKANRLILAAGALGTPYLLLKNRASFPALSDRLGTRFGTNGDMITFASECRNDGGQSYRRVDATYGPAITAALRFADAADGGGAAAGARGHYIEDAGYPQLLNWLIEAANFPGITRRAAGLLVRRLRARLSGRTDSDITADVGALLGRAELSSSSMPLLGMGRDASDGRMALRRGLLEIATTNRSDAYFDALIEDMRAIARSVNAKLVTSPTWTLGRRTATVHPLGGAPMGRDAKEGVVDAWGRVFNYPGLHIADGSVMPGAIGANPSLTIAAFADRVADGILHNT